jgi:hypothetical protein
VEDLTIIERSFEVDLLAILRADLLAMCKLNLDNVEADLLT